MASVAKAKGRNNKRSCYQQTILTGFVGHFPRGGHLVELLRHVLMDFCKFDIIKPKAIPGQNRNVTEWTKHN